MTEEEFEEYLNWTEQQIIEMEQDYPLKRTSFTKIKYIQEE